MSVGFVMLAHDALHRAVQVAEVIAETGNPLIIHVDARTEKTVFQKFKSQIDSLPGVSLAPRIACHWGTWSLVQASRDGAEALLRENLELTHVCLISGACLPIKSLADFEAFLRANPNTDFIESVKIDEVVWTKGGLSEERFTLTFPFAWRRQRRLFDLWVEMQRLVRRKRKLPSGLNPHMGSQWWCLTRATLERILTDPNREELDRYFRRVWIPDESYFQSLVRLYGTKIESRSLTLSKFDYQGKPHVFYDDHLQLLRHSPSFFARKIWPGANRLYRAFLDGRRVSVISPLSPAHIDRTFAQSINRRTRGRPGLVTTSRFPGKDVESAVTAAPYAVFHGFSDIFEDFSAWVMRNSGSQSHGHLFASNRVEFANQQTGYAGALSDSAALRDYDPQAFLRNLIWNTRGAHQSFLFGSADSQEICEHLAADPNATLSLVTGAWAIPLSGSGLPVAALRQQAALYQQREADFLKLLNERRAGARTRVWSLAEFLEHPIDPLQEITDALSGAERHLLTDLPRFKPMDGLPAFLQALRNAGMNPYLAGEVTSVPSTMNSAPAPLELRQ
ncbi:MAG: beta-1,6-N-acetylglucosaminyltransferase [Pseudomonadota bacterium]